MGGSYYDVIIIGGGPAGLTAGLYTARARLSTLLIERGIFGGQIANVSWIENYPGFPEGISGYELAQRMYQQGEKFGIETVTTEATGIELEGETKIVKTGEGNYRARAVIIAGGAHLRQLGVPGEERLTGKGVSYCATCDGPFFRDRVVAVVGGGDSAIEEGIYLTRFASKINLIHRRDQLRASKLLQERCFSNPKMEFYWDAVVEDIGGDERAENIHLRNVKTGEITTLEVDGVFIYVGLKPNTDYLKGLLTLDEGKQIIVNDQMETESPGIFAAGDIHHNSPRQVITAAGDGATAALSATRFLEGI